MRMEEVQGRKAARIPPKNAVLEVEGRFIPLNEEGYLADPADWSPAVAEYMATVDGLELGDDHWLMINFLHRFYQEFQLAPEMHVLARNLCKDQRDCRWTRSYIVKLFPDGAMMACRYAGLPAPLGGCI